MTSTTATPATRDGQVTPLETALLNQLRDAEQRISQLQTALDTRIVIEQAKGILAERLGLTTDSAFTILRQATDSAQLPGRRLTLRELAAQTVNDPHTPTPIIYTLARKQQWTDGVLAQRNRLRRARMDHLTESVRIARHHPSQTLKEPHATSQNRRQ